MHAPNPVPPHALDAMRAFVRTSFDSRAVSEAIGRDMLGVVRPFLRTRRACEDLLPALPPGSWAMDQVMAHRSSLPPDPPGAPGLQHGLVQMLQRDAARMSRSLRAAQDFDRFALEAVRPHARTPEDLYEIVRAVPPQLQPLAAPSRMAREALARMLAGSGARRNAPHDLVTRARDSGLRCPWCMDVVTEADERLTCPGCRAGQHMACAREADGTCGTCRRELVVPRGQWVEVTPRCRLCGVAAQTRDGRCQDCWRPPVQTRPAPGHCRLCGGAGPLDRWARCGDCGHHPLARMNAGSCRCGARASGSCSWCGTGLCPWCRDADGYCGHCGQRPLPMHKIDRERFVAPMNADVRPAPLYGYEPLGRGKRRRGRAGPRENPPEGEDRWYVADADREALPVLASDDAPGPDDLWWRANPQDEERVARRRGRSRVHAPTLLEDMQAVAARFQEHAVEERRPYFTTPGVPFPTFKGFIRAEENVYVHGGYYGVPRTFTCGVKVGGAVDLAVHRQVKEAVREAVLARGLTFGETSGSAWSFYGALAP